MTAGAPRRSPKAGRRKNDGQDHAEDDPKTQLTHTLHHGVGRGFSL